jgi:glycosyltransferase involved in cell wall biosynthesis
MKNLKPRLKNFMILPSLVKMNKKLQIYILCRDRPEYAIQAIESVVQSADASSEIIISDNSETDSLEKICSKRFPSIRYIRRQPPRTSQAHFKAILDEATSEYLVLFHDDDIMLPNYVSTLLPYIEANPLVSAVGCNAEIIDKNGKVSSNFFLRNLNEPLFISKAHQLMTPYLIGNDRSTGIVPFPSYMYRRKHICSSFINYKHGGKYSDVSFLLKILQRASVVWHPEPLMYSRIHGLNDSSTESIPDKLSLIRYLITLKDFDRSSLEIRYYKFTYWLIWWGGNHKSFYFFVPNGWREKIIFRFLARTSIRFLIYDSAFRKVFVRKVVKLLT